jgi:hypothetical protein
MDTPAHSQDDPAAGRRMLADRRTAATQVVSRYTFRGGRRRNRRSSDPDSRYYVDWIDGLYAWSLLLLAAFICFDTFSTLFILARGGVELNPLMVWFLRQGDGWFIAAKLIPPLFVFPMLAVHRFFFVGRFGTFFLLAVYGWVFMVHLTVLANMGF